MPWILSAILALRASSARGCLHLIVGNQENETIKPRQIIRGFSEYKMLLKCASCLSSLIQVLQHLCAKKNYFLNVRSIPSFLKFLDLSVTTQTLVRLFLKNLVCAQSNTSTVFAIIHTTFVLFKLLLFKPKNPANKNLHTI